ncbi:MAG: Mur ligase family protein [Patescibacteria group bacterium]|nr:Mur ligase family protein [Patescibacteria group bacterium]
MALSPPIIQRNPILKAIRQGLVWIFLYYIRFFARLSLLFFKGTSIGIAGAVGKSTTRDALKAILSSHKPTHVVTGNSETGIPLGLLGLDIGSYRLIDIFRVIILAPINIFHLKPYEFLIVEMGIDGPKPPKNMGYLLTIIKPTIGILLNESPAHVGNYEGMLKAKKLETIVSFMTEDDGAMLKTTHVAIINGDDPHIQTFAKRLPQHSVRTVGTSPHHDMFLRYYDPTEDGTLFEFTIHAFQKKEDLSLFFPQSILPEEAGIAIGSAILCAVSVGVNLADIQKNVSQTFSLPPGRGTILRGVNKSVIIDSSYNISSASAISFLHVMKRFSQKTRTPTVFVMGDMKELGSFAPEEHARVAKVIPDSVDHVVLVGRLTRELVLPHLHRHKKRLKTLIHVDTSKDAGEYLQRHLPRKAIILFKGSQFLEEAIKCILENREDIKKLCRQDAFWKKAKIKHGVWVEV